MARASYSSTGKKAKAVKGASPFGTPSTPVFPGGQFISPQSRSDHGSRPGTTKHTKGSPGVAVPASSAAVANYADKGKRAATSKSGSDSGNKREVKVPFPGPGSN